MKKEKVVKINPSLKQLQKIKYICEAMEEINNIVNEPPIEDYYDQIEDRYYRICDVLKDLDKKVGV